MEGEFLEVKARRPPRPPPGAARASPAGNDNKQYVKTRMCIYFEKNGRCRNGDQCPYAHSKSEIVSPQCHYGAACRFKERCKFSHPAPVPESPPSPARPVFSSAEFPPMSVASVPGETTASSSASFRDVCASGDGQKTLTIGSGDSQAIKNAVQEIRSAFETKPDTVFNLCFQ